MAFLTYSGVFSKSSKSITLKNFNKLSLHFVLTLLLQISS